MEHTTLPAPSLLLATKWNLDIGTTIMQAFSKKSDLKILDLSYSSVKQQTINITEIVLNVSNCPYLTLASINDLKQLLPHIKIIYDEEWTNFVPFIK